MMIRLVRFAVVLSVIVGVTGRLPLLAARNIVPQAQNTHPCCPKSQAPQNAGMPYGHSCCRLQLPAKLPPGAEKSCDSPDSYVVSPATLSLFTRDCGLASQTSAIAQRARSASRLVLRI
jgi:hypothetical protein